MYILKDEMVFGPIKTRIKGWRGGSDVSETVRQVL